MRLANESMMANYKHYVSLEEGTLSLARRCRLLGSRVQSCRQLGIERSGGLQMPQSGIGLEKWRLGK
jgi:hypothetical protein